ncbi:MAG: hypothetical protein ABEJ86_03050 [Halococcoides sp.]
MSATARHTDAPAADQVAASLDSAAFVRIVAAPTGGAIAAAGLLGRACRDRSIGFQVSVAPRGNRETDADLTVAIGCRVDADTVVPAASSVAADIVCALDGDPDPALSAVESRLAGRGASDPTPGIAGPTGNPVDDLAHSTLLHAPFSGDTGAVEALCSDIGIDPVNPGRNALRRLAGAAAVRAVAEAPPAAGEAVEAAIGSQEGGPFASIGGFADVLDALARERPGDATTLALGGTVSGAIDRWREHAVRAHRALGAADRSRYDGLSVRRLDPDAPVGTVARLAVRFDAPESVVLALAGDRVAVASRSDADAERRLATVADRCGGRAIGDATRAIGRIDADATDVIASVREVGS